MFRKVYVDVLLTQTKYGKTVPHSLIFEDNKKYEIERVISSCRSPSVKVGGGKIRYTVVVSGHETFLFEDMGRWFVEAWSQID